ncbi:Hsp20/alpha crystallin family protein [Hymenobacter tenuis]
MAIQKYQDSFSDQASSSFSTMLDRFFNDSLASRGKVNSFSPHVDAYETEKSYEIEASLPGMKREDIKVDFHQGRLTIAGERSFQNEQRGRRYHLVESSYGTFQRSLQLPDTVDASHIEASFEDGLLRVSVPKDQQKTARHQIEIRGGQGQQAQQGQVSGQSGQQATDVPVQGSSGGNDSGKNKASAANSAKSTSADPMQEMNKRPKSSGVGS